MQFLKQYRKQFPHHLCRQLISIAKDPSGARYAAGVMNGTESRVELKAMDSTTLELGSEWTPNLTRELCRELEKHLFPALTDYVNQCVVGPIQQPYTIDTVRERYSLVQPPRLNHYKAPEQAYHGWHSDWGPVAKEREITCLLYLNDVAEGGETEFYHQGVKIRPEEGKMIISPSGYTHTHRSVPPTSEDKYICIFWIGRSATANKPRRKD